MAFEGLDTILLLNLTIAALRMEMIILCRVLRWDLIPKVREYRIGECMYLVVSTGLLGVTIARWVI